ncbi:MAG: DUF1292 domain-containing protein [Erysipelotrichaceae bacterium]|nr:DUF1292 domain-containing protein [Erysipelotrichaceae bacterium]MBR2787815.1 DUF1292 domain-containing protein [Erysipelotrichaceae bacterium]
MKENSIFITDDDGKEIEMKIYFTFDANDKQYVIVYEEGHEDELYPLIYDDQGNIYPVEDEEEMEMIDEIVSGYEGALTDQDEEEKK